VIARQTEIYLPGRQV